MIEPKIGEIITVEDVKYVTKLAVNPDVQCDECCLYGKPCMHISCTSFVREDSKAVIFKEVKEMKVKIQIPDNCELIKDGDTYIVKEKKQNPPRSWEEFCRRYPKQEGESFIGVSSVIQIYDEPSQRFIDSDKNICTSKEEAEAFLALMQLRQLRKAWVGEWKPSYGTDYSAIVVTNGTNNFDIGYGYWSYNYPMTFPTKEMAKDFLNCFKDLCETAKILL